MNQAIKVLQLEANNYKRKIAELTYYTQDEGIEAAFIESELIILKKRLKELIEAVEILRKIN